MNLLVNAVQALSRSPPDRRRARIEAERRGRDQLVVSIQDSGPEIPVDALQKLFDPFYTTRTQGIAVRLGIAEKRAKIQRAHLMRKLRLTRVAEPIAICERAGIAPWSDSDA